MKAFGELTGIVAALDKSNIDTDAIIPKQFLKSIKRTGFGQHLFDEWRFDDVGDLNSVAEKRIKNKSFVLNQPRYKGATILLARENFGCGSSREHAVWALMDYGFRVVLAPSFADIFYNNSFKNGLLPICLADKEIDKIFEESMATEGYSLFIDLPTQVVRRPDGSEVKFDIEAFRKSCLIEGLDEIGVTLRDKAAIEIYEEKKRKSSPWLFRDTAN